MECYWWERKTWKENEKVFLFLWIRRCSEKCNGFWSLFQTKSILKYLKGIWGVSFAWQLIRIFDLRNEYFWHSNTFIIRFNLSLALLMLRIHKMEFFTFFSTFTWRLLWRSDRTAHTSTKFNENKMWNWNWIPWNSP